MVLSTPLSEPVPKKISGSVPEEHGYDLGIAAPESSRFSHESEQPLQPCSLHPGGCLLNRTGVEVECRPHCYQKVDVGMLRQPGCELLLFRGADADPHNIGFSVIDLPGNRFKIKLIDRQKGWRIGSADILISKGLQAGLLQFRGHPVISSTNKVPDPRTCSLHHQFGKKVRS